MTLDPDPLHVDDERIPSSKPYRLVHDSPRRGCSVIPFLLLPLALAEALRAVAFDLPFRDGPRLADEPSAQLAVADLAAKRRSRQPETGGGFGQGEHLGHDFGMRSLIFHDLIETGLERGTLGLGALLGRVGEQLHKARLRSLVEHLRCVHRFSFGSAARDNLHHIVQVVKRVLSGFLLMAWRMR